MKTFISLFIISLIVGVFVFLQDKNDNLQIEEEVTKKIVEVEKIKNLVDKEINEIISYEVKKANEGLSSIEKIRKFIIAEEPFSTENGLLTPTMKVRRHKVFEIYGEKLDDLYGSKTH